MTTFCPCEDYRPEDCLIHNDWSTVSEQQQNRDGTWSPAKPLKGSWWVRLELRLRRRGML